MYVGNLSGMHLHVLYRIGSNRWQMLHTERRRYGDVAEATYAYAYSGHDARYTRIPSGKVKR